MSSTKKDKIEQVLGLIFDSGDRGIRRKDLAAGFNKNTLDRCINTLEDDGDVTKRHEEINGRSIPFYIVPSDRRQKVKDRLGRKKMKEDIDNLPLKRVEKLQKELEGYKRQERIDELEKFALPAKAVWEKIQDLGLAKELRLKKHPTFSDAFSDGDLIDVGIGGIFDEYKPDQIEVKKIPFDEFERQYAHRGWVVVCRKGVKNRREGRDSVHLEGFVIAAAYKELLELFKAQFEDTWLSWKERFDLTDKEWSYFGPRVREMMEHDQINAEIENYLGPYANSKTPEGQRRIFKYYKQYAGHPKAISGISTEEDAKEMANYIIDQNKQLRDVIEAYPPSEVEAIMARKNEEEKKEWEEADKAASEAIKAKRLRGEKNSPIPSTFNDASLQFTEDSPSAI